MTETSASTTTHATRPASTRIIDGEAVVLSRRHGVKSPEAAAAPIFPPVDEPETAPVTDTAYIFERRQHPMARAPLPARRYPEADLLFQPQPTQRFAPPTRVDGLSLFLKDTAGAMPRSGRMAGLGAMALSILLPAILFLAPEGPVGSAMAGVQSGGFRVAGLSARIVARGDGAVLAVEGTIHNAAARATRVPPLRIALKSANGVTQTRMLATSATSLAAGGSLTFHSAVAVPAGSRGDVSVDFIDDVRFDATGPSPR
ncbi:hypothetical protein [Aureimonas glaciei]|uniref:DUF3426 domain-containing protein n=1 Tax=Aureimonas glaciei TaxID=1776957 RepID=A0A917DFY0_9HYPH|nr:hypothetical protein [Aureimonas glaciei]GGD32554.1 hypothetical protein GCM10011335_39460 [Aureimonas glaciei]